MTDGDRLLAAILEYPAEDTPRLVYADWLDENGEGERAHYIRWLLKGRFTHPFPRVSFRKWFRPFWTGATCRRHLVNDDNIPTLWLMKVRAAGELSPAAQMRVTRGFVSSITCTADDWLANADAIVAAHPLERIVLPHCRAEIVAPDGDSPRWRASYFETPRWPTVPHSTNWWTTRAEMVAGVLADVAHLEAEFS